MPHFSGPFVINMKGAGFKSLMSPQLMWQPFLNITADNKQQATLNASGDLIRNATQLVGRVTKDAKTNGKSPNKIPNSQQAIHRISSLHLSPSLYTQQQRKADGKKKMEKHHTVYFGIL